MSFIENKKQYIGRLLWNKKREAEARSAADFEKATAIVDRLPTTRRLQREHKATLNALKKHRKKLLAPAWAKHKARNHAIDKKMAEIEGRIVFGADYDSMMEMLKEMDKL